MAVEALAGQYECRLFVSAPVHGTQGAVIQERKEEKEGKMKAVVIVDNLAGSGCRGEWGLSVLIEYQGKKILLDTGKSELFAENAAKLGIALESVDFGVLSHAHYDHADGIREFCRLNPTAPFYLQEACGENCWRRKKLFFRKYIGISEGTLEQCRNRIRYVSGVFRVCDGVTLIQHSTPGLEKLGRREKMYVKTPAGWRYDSFQHEQSLVFETANGLVIFNSCSHGGVINTIREAQAAIPHRNITAYIGGFHLYNKTEKEIRTLAEEIRKIGLKTIYTGHCTGEEGFQILKEELPEIVHQLQVGLVMEFDAS